MCDVTLWRQLLFATGGDAILVVQSVIDVALPS